jgi:hypothetical protein
MNRVQDRIEHRRALLLAGIKPDGTPITADLAQAERNLDLTFEEHYEFQQTQVWAYVTGLINVDEAQTIYAALGEVPAADGWADTTDLASKLVITVLMGEILERKIRSAVA